MSRAVIQFSGNLTGDPELRFLGDGTPVASFGVAVNERKKDPGGGWVDGDPSFYRCTAWRRLAENVADGLSRGERVVVTGFMSMRTYEKDGRSVQAWDVTVEDVGKSLMFAGAPRSTPPTSAQQDEAPF